MSSRSEVVLKDAVVILTGASRGIGPVIAQALAERGAHLVLAARNATELQGVAERLASLNGGSGRVLCVPTDVAVPEQRSELVARTLRELGRIDVLINNAGLEQIEFFEHLSEADTERFVTVNLTAPIQLTRLVLPSMLERGSGHIVNIASVASFGAAAFGETYGATKAGLLGFTRSLRASLKTLDRSVSASAVCPGFIESAGMFADAQAAHAVRAPAILGTCTPEAVAASVVSAIENDEPESIVTRRPMRLMLAVGLLFPRLLERLTLRLGVNAMFLQIARAEQERRLSVVSGDERPAKAKAG